MTIKQHGGVFGRNPSFNDVSVETLSIAGTTLASTAAELNILDGVTADATEINYLDGASTSVVTASKAVLANASANIAFASGSGIDFSATGDAGGMTSELFDDYEEGTWTPSLGGTTTYLAQGGTYTKVGRVVNFHCVLYINVIGTGSVTNIGGLPFAATITGQGTVTILGDCNTAITYLVGYVNSSQITLKGTTAASAAIADISVFKALTYIEIFGSYTA
jgi:hypothetical protein